jgi:hypothetical protein
MNRPGIERCSLKTCRPGEDEAKKKPVEKSRLYGAGFPESDEPTSKLASCLKAVITLAIIFFELFGERGIFFVSRSWLVVA